MDPEQSGVRIVCSVVRDYVLAVPSTRVFLFPTFAAAILAKLLEVMVTNSYKEISLAIKTNSDAAGVLRFYAGIVLLSVLIGELQSFFICKAGQAGYRLANRRAYRYFMCLPPSEFKTLRKGEIQNAIAKKSQAVQDIIDVLTLNFFPAFLTILFTSWCIIRNIGFVPMMLTNVAVAAYAVLTVKITGMRNTTRRKINTASNTSLNIQLDGLLNYETIHIHNSQAYEIEKYDSSLKELEIYNTRLEQSKYCLNLAQRGVWSILSILIITISTLGIAVKKMTTDELALFIGVVGVLVGSLNNFGFMYGKFQSALINIRAYSFTPARIKPAQIHHTHELSSSLDAKGLVVRANGKVLIEGADFTIRKGDKVAIIGKNGVGKSSLIKSLLRINPLDQGDGTVQVDGVDIQDITDETFCDLVSYVPQDPRLFNETVMYNIKYGARKAYDEDVYRLSKKLGLHESIARLEKGYYTCVGEQGSALSGGERQKIIVLRALIRNAPILVMDEPTASLDKAAEKQIIKAILGCPNLTVIAIVHNLALLNEFSRVLIVEKKGVIEVDSISDLDMENWVSPITPA